jgi:cadmium resistance protein CadD (predicted permease)
MTKLLSRYGHIVMPLVLIGLGIFIVVESGTLSLFSRG